MDFEKFEESLSAEKPPPEWSTVLRSLWYDANGDWHAAHNLVDGKSTQMAKWVHAYLHRKEGDEWNAGYWYRQAGKPLCRTSLEEEFNILLEANL